MSVQLLHGHMKLEMNLNIAFGAQNSIPRKGGGHSEGAGCHNFIHFLSIKEQ